MALLAVLASGTVWAGINVWTSLGPDGGGAGRLVIDPRDSSTVFAVTDTGLVKSTDGGASWRAIYSLPSGLLSPSSSAILSLVIDPQTAGTLYVAANLSGSALVIKSTDGGENWQGVLSGASALAIDPQDPRIVYAGGYSEMFKTTDGGTTWVSSNSWLPRPFLAPRPLVDQQNPSTVYALTGGGLFKSANRGASWNAVYLYPGLEAYPGMETPYFITVELDPQNSGTLYAVSGSVTSEGSILKGVYKSTDGGVSWSLSNFGAA